MDKRETTLLVWILSLATVLVIILYSPIGSPDMYSTKNGFSSMTGVMFGGRIENSSGVGNFGGQSNPELIIDTYRINGPSSPSLNSATENVSVEVADPTKKEMPVYTKENKKRISYKVAANSKSESEQNANYSVAGRSSKESEYSNSGGSAGAGGMTPVYGSSGRNSRNNSNSGYNDFSVATLDLSLFSDSTRNKRAVDYAVDQGGTDPGGNPTTEPIPVSNGTLFMFVLGSVYALVKRFKLVNLLTQKK